MSLLEAHKINPKPRRRETEKLEKQLVDAEYTEFFSRFSKDDLKSFAFFDDIPGLTARNAFRLQKSGDKNNQCFDSVYFKHLSKYNLKDRDATKPTAQSSKKPPLTRKQLRRMQINTAREKRYFVQLGKITYDDETRPNLKLNSTLSDKMWLYLEMNKTSSSSLNNESNVDRTGDFMKYLNENKSDEDKWLEFVDYQAILAKKQSLNPSALFEKKKAIFERAIQENSASFRLKIELVKLKANSIEFTGIYNAFETIEREFYMLLSSESLKLNVKKINESDLMSIVVNLFEIWFELIKFSVNYNSSNVLFDQIKRQFTKCFAFFLKSSNAHLTRLANRAAYQSLLLQMLDNYCGFLLRSGYVEKAVGIYQALLDFNLCTTGRNEYKNVDARSRRTLFELFWDIGLPKFGERFSSGWLDCLERKEQIREMIENSNDHQPRTDDLMDTIENSILENRTLRIEHRWLEIERIRSLAYWYPFYARSSMGETSDDCCDPDRLIAYEDDIEPFLVDLNPLLKSPLDTSIYEGFKFKLLVGLLKIFRLVSVDDESLDLHSTHAKLIHSNNLIADDTFLDFICQTCSFMNDYQRKTSEMPFLETSSYLDVLIRNLFNRETTSEKERQLYEQTAENLINFIRQSLSQSLASFESFQFRTHLTLLRWQFELHLYLSLTSNHPSTTITPKPIFDAKQVKENLLNQCKQDLSKEANRSNFAMWREYGVLKLLLNKGQLKETKKIFDTLLKTSESSQKSHDQACIDIYSLCVDYTLAELGSFYRQFDIETSNLEIKNDQTEVHISTKLDFFDLKKSNHSLKQVYSNSVKDALSSLLVQNCLQKPSKSKSKSSTFKIEISGSTRILLVKRDFQVEYDQIYQESKSKSFDSEKKFALYHQVYSLFLLVLNDYDKLIEINEELLFKQQHLIYFKSRLTEFYVNLLNHLFYRECKLDKFRYKTRLYEVVRSVLSTGNRLVTKSLLNLLRVTLIRFKLDLSSALVNPIVESSDADAIFTALAGLEEFSIAHIASHLIRVERIVRGNNYQDFSASTLGVSHQIRRLFDYYVQINPKSPHLWLLYFMFESSVALSSGSAVDPNLIELSSTSTSKSSKRLLSVYYQSVRSLPYFKIFYLYAVKYQPEQYNDIMSILYGKELRVYLPIQELNVLLEPIKDPSELDKEMEEAEDEESENKSVEMASSEVDEQLSSIEDEEEEETEENYELVDMSESSADEEFALNNL